MTKRQFISKLAATNNFSAAYAEKILNAVLDSMEDALFRDGRIVLPGLGIFVVRAIPERTGRNPLTGESIVIPACKRLFFRASSHLKELLN